MSTYYHSLEHTLLHHMKSETETKWIHILHFCKAGWPQDVQDINDLLGQWKAQPWALLLARDSHSHAGIL